MGEKVASRIYDEYSHRPKKHLLLGSSTNEVSNKWRIWDLPKSSQFTRHFMSLLGRPPQVGDPDPISMNEPQEGKSKRPYFFRSRSTPGSVHILHNALGAIKDFGDCVILLLQTKEF